MSEERELLGPEYPQLDMRCFHSALIAPGSPPGWTVSHRFKREDPNWVEYVQLDFFCPNPWSRPSVRINQKLPWPNHPMEWPWDDCLSRMSLLRTRWGLQLTDTVGIGTLYIALYRVWATYCYWIIDKYGQDYLPPRRWDAKKNQPDDWLQWVIESNAKAIDLLAYFDKLEWDFVRGVHSPLHKYIGLQAHSPFENTYD